MAAAIGRRLRALALPASLLMSFVSGSPFSPGALAHPGSSQLMHARQDSTGSALAITGVNDGDASIHPRLEVRDLVTNTAQWNLYLLGLQRMQATDQADKESWYQVAAIHGMPFVAWDGVQSTGDDESGYCLHQSNLFLPWHRPYVALFEQILQKLMLEVANEFPAGPTRDNYTNAANTFRCPFWDWAKHPPDGQTNVPDVMTTPTVTVTTPNGTQTIPNPLYAYTYHPLNGQAFYDQNSPQFSVYKSSLRYPTDLTAQATSQESGVSTNMNNLRPQLRDALYDLFTNYDNFTVFGNMASYHPSQYQSLEAVHGWVHNYLGGEHGNMLEVPWSAFDPAFMLHHAMIDRCFALWQALHPDSYVEPEVQDYPTFMVQGGSTQDANSPLAPFHSSSSGDFWTSNSARDVKTFFYTYPELQNSNTASLKAAVNNLYGQSTVAHRTKRDLIDDVGNVVSSLVQPAQIDPSAATNDRMRHEYTANIKIEKCALGGPGNIYIFFGNFSSNQADWMTDDNLAGSSALFVAGNTAALKMDNSKALYGSIPLTRELEQRVASQELGCMDPADVVPYLTTHLAWRVATSDGTVIPNDQVAGLEISIVSAQYRPAASESEFPERVGDFQTLSEITNGKAGGLGM